MKPRRLTLLGLSPALPFTLYWWQLRKRAVQELLAATGIAVGVALVFGVLVANSSISGSVRSLVHQLVGSAQVQLAARSQEGFGEKLLGEVEAMPGVGAASPILRESITLTNAHGRSMVVQLIGVTSRQFLLNPLAANDLGSGAESLVSGGLALPQAVARALAARPEDTLTVKANGQTRPVRVRVVLGSEAVGAVANSPVAVSTLYTAQQLTGMAGRVTNVLVRAKPHAEQSVVRGLSRIAAGRLNVTPADNELRMFEAAVRPNEESTTLFAAIAGMVGFLLALNAMLMTVPERRRLVAELRTFGYGPQQIALLITVQATLLGLFGSAVGIAAGAVLAHTLFGSVPSYLTTAFPIGSARIVTAPTLLIAVASGVGAALIASARPLLDLKSRHEPDMAAHESGEGGQHVSYRIASWLAVCGAALVAMTAALAALVPSLTIVGGALLALAAVCIVPAAYRGVVSMARPPSERSKATFAIAVVELESTATRSIALAAVAALAVYGGIAINGAKADLTRGLERAIAQYETTADVWVTSDQSVFNIDSFQSRQATAAIARSPYVRSARALDGSLLDVGDRRLWIGAHSPQTAEILETSQILQGDARQAGALVRGGGWATVSQGFAAERNLRVGSTFTLPAPAGPLPLRVAAITTNLGWPAGAITMSIGDYARGWPGAAPTAFEVMLKPGVAPASARAAIQAALGSSSALHAQTSGEREAQTDSSARQGLQSLGDISALILVAGALAVAASLSAAIWQRRSRFAAMKTWGYDHRQLWRAMLIESVMLLSAGVAEGAVLGVYGHVLADRWLRVTTDFPAPFAFGGPQLFLTLAVLVGISVAALAIPGMLAARVSPSTSFQE